MTQFQTPPTVELTDLQMSFNLFYFLTDDSISDSLELEYLIIEFNEPQGRHRITYFKFLLCLIIH